MRWLIVGVLQLLFVKAVFAQDTFSIVAVDETTGEVGSAGASCVDLTTLTGYKNDFLGELFPGKGAINTQAYYDRTNQSNARNRMNLGDTPTEIIQWLKSNDVTNRPELRQYGIVAIVNGKAQAAAHTGSSTDDFKNHITGTNYAVQGNILLGQSVLDAMEANFLNEKGDLACKLMAALQGANLVGADTRCKNNGTSSLFAFVKVAKPGDTFGNPSFLLSVKTADGDKKEPIDSLQTLFDKAHSCKTVGILENDLKAYKVFPNPVANNLTIHGAGVGAVKVSISDNMGRVFYESVFVDQENIDVAHLPKGVYQIQLSHKSSTTIKRLIKQ